MRSFANLASLLQVDASRQTTTSINQIISPKCKLKKKIMSSSSTNKMACFCGKQEQLAAKKSPQLVLTTNILLFSVLATAWLAQTQWLGVAGSLQPSSPSTYFFNIHPQIYSTQSHNYNNNHQNQYLQQNAAQQVPFKTSFVGPSDYIPFRKMSSPLESLSPSSDESMISGGSSSSNVAGGLLVSEQLASEPNNEQSKPNDDPLMLAASSKAPETASNQADSNANNSTTTTTKMSAHNSTTSTTTSVQWSTSSTSSQKQEQQTTLPLQQPTTIAPTTTQSVDVKSRENTQTTTMTSVTDPVSTAATSNNNSILEEKNVARSSQEVASTGESAALQNNSDATTRQAPSPSTPTTMVKPTTLEITINNLSSLSTPIPFMLTGETTTITTTTTTTSTPMPSLQTTEESAAPSTTVALHASQLEIQANNTSNTTSGSVPTSSAERTQINETTQKFNQQSIAADLDRNVEQNLTRVVNEFVFMPQDGSSNNNNDKPLTFEDQEPAKFQAPDTPTSELRAEHRNIDDDISSMNIMKSDDGEVELDYLNPESDRLPAQNLQQHQITSSTGKSTAWPSYTRRYEPSSSNQNYETSKNVPLKSSTTPMVPTSFTLSFTTASSTTTTAATPSTSFTATTPEPTTTTTTTAQPPSSTTAASVPTTTTNSSGTRSSAKSVGNRLISHVVSMLRNTNNNNNNNSDKIGNNREDYRSSTTKRPRFDWKRGRFTKEFGDDYLGRDLSPIANGADEEEARILTRLAAPSQFSRLKSIQKSQAGAPNGSANLAGQLPEQSRSARLNNNHRPRVAANPTNELRISSDNNQQQQTAQATSASIHEVGRQLENNNNDLNKRQLSVKGPSEVRSRHIEIKNQDEGPIIGRISRQQFSDLKNNQKSLRQDEQQQHHKLINPVSSTSTTTTTNSPPAIMMSHNSSLTSTTTNPPITTIINTNINVSHQLPTKEIFVKTQRASPIPIPTIGIVLQPATTTTTTNSKNLSPITQSSTILPSASSSTPFMQPFSSTTTSASTTEGKHIATFGEPQELTSQTISPLDEVLTLIAGTAGANVSRAQLLAELNPSQSTLSNSNNNQYQYQSSPSVASFTISQEEQSRNAVMEAVIADIVQQRENYEQSAKRAMASKQQNQQRLSNSYRSIGKSRPINDNKQQHQNKVPAIKVNAGPNTIAKPHSDLQGKRETTATLKLRGSFEEMKQQDDEQFRNTLRAEQQQHQPNLQVSSADADGDYKPHDMTRRRQRQQAASTELPTDSGKWKPDVTQSPRQQDSSASSSGTTTADHMPGKPGIDYPTHWQVPKTSFDCRNYELSGFYADVESSCQAYHSCHKGRGGQHTFLCPNGTLFSQELLTCDWWYNVDCSPPTGSRLAAKQTINNLDKSFMPGPANEHSSASS